MIAATTTDPQIATPQWLLDLEREVAGHPAVNHMLLCRLATGPYTRFDYMNFGLQHHALVGFFTGYMEQLLVRAPDSAAKMWLAKVLVDEYGEGSEGKDHVTLYREFLGHAGAPEGAELNTDLCSEAWGFVREHVRICQEEPFLVGMGALGPGHEWAIPKMFGHIIPGLRRAGFPDDEISYFLLHVEQDQDHGRWMTEVLATTVTTETEQEQVRRGARLSLEARRRLYTGVERFIVARRQPESLKAVERGLIGIRQSDGYQPSPGNLGALRTATAAALRSEHWPGWGGQAQ